MKHFVGSLLVFSSFCFIASSIYILNDWIDRHQDRKHPVKCNRPIAKGDIDGKEALLLGIGSVFLAMVCLMVNPFPNQIITFIIICSYVFLMLIYNAGLKHQFGTDILIVSSGYVLRAVAGGKAINVPVTSWFILTIFFLCLLLILGKRRSELVLLDGKTSLEHRPVQEYYTTELLDQFIIISATASLMTYTLYTVTESRARNMFGHMLPLTVIFVVYGIFRYLYVLYVQKKGSAPEEIFYRDRSIQVTLLLWSIVILVLFLLENKYLF